MYFKKQNGWWSFTAKNFSTSRDDLTCSLFRFVFFFFFVFVLRVSLAFFRLAPQNKHKIQPLFSSKWFFFTNWTNLFFSRKSKSQVARADNSQTTLRLFTCGLRLLLFTCIWSKDIHYPEKKTTNHAIISFKKPNFQPRNSFIRTQIRVQNSVPVSKKKSTYFTSSRYSSDRKLTNLPLYNHFE